VRARAIKRERAREKERESGRKRGRERQRKGEGEREKTYPQWSQIIGTGHKHKRGAGKKNIQNNVANHHRHKSHAMLEDGRGDKKRKKNPCT